jgi:phosphatidate cytidylyltransferase
MRERVLSGLILGPFVIALFVLGKVWLSLFIMVVGGIALIEFAHLAARRGHRAFSGLMLLWMGLFVLDRMMPETGLLAPGMALLLLITMAWTLYRYRQGTVDAPVGFAMTLGGSLYVGWPAAHYISLRALNDGLFWTLTTVLTVWVADTAAYSIGRRIGHTPLIKDISPNKTWEGYISGIVAGTAAAGLLPLLWRALGASAAVTPGRALIIGLLISVISPLGDLGVSMIKRWANAKDSSNLIPGHGGLLDRTDSILVAGLLSYYALTLFLL